MKRNFSCSDSLTHFFPPLEEEMNPKEDCIYNGEFQAMLEGGGGDSGGGGDGGGGEDYSLEEIGQIGDKKRRLSNHQVKSLEKIFEIDNKLDPDRKVKVAEDLGLQPRQVAIWFQNRRARWKTKQLERDYTLLKANYDSLKNNYHKLEQEKQTIIKELLELKSKLQEETIERNENFDSKEKSFIMEYDTRDSNHEIYTSLNHKKVRKSTDLKDGFSDSDSSGVLNEESILTSNINDNQLLSMSNFDFSSTMPLNLNCTQFMDSNACLTKAYQQQESMMKMEDEFLVSSSEESCNIFSIDQAPNLCWYFSEA